MGFGGFFGGKGSAKYLVSEERVGVIGRCTLSYCDAMKEEVLSRTLNSLDFKEANSSILSGQLCLGAATLLEGQPMSE